MHPSHVALGSGHRDPLGEVTAASRQYLKAIWDASEWASDPVTTKTVAERVGVSPSTASDAVRRLADKGLVTHQRYGAVALSSRGHALAAHVIRRMRLIESFLVRELGYGWHEVHDDADTLANAASDDLIERIDRRLGHPTRDPHGDPIPAADGRVPTPSLRPLATCDTGDTGTVARIADSDPAMLEYFGSVGLTLDSGVTVHAKRPFAGTMRISVTGFAEMELGDVAIRSVWLTAADHG
ncbi:winged helix-turn-helix transcriptional regulator [Gordonia sp. SID5947]|uniref:metal-dependent transcriptional regulator n=1 Tax=Gordonia sp. SID5947 TaxID=2690315 RepID=UPI00137140F2|nr:metal-dependent transcriptional regulator [Gordonia sp. SID5947]MYR06804.1 winged helix-turn-helix transcriptional regulator [Gordonia sp. SID5947]